MKHIEHTLSFLTTGEDNYVLGATTTPSQTAQNQHQGGLLSRLVRVVLNRAIQESLRKHTKI